MSLGDEMERCRPWIEAALEYSGGTHTFDDVCAGVASGKMQLWPAPEGCAVTEIVVYPRKTVLNVFLAGGKMWQVLDGIESIAQFARLEGCSGVTLSGRRGWQRVLAAHGFKTTAVTMEREL